jgi:hypothetical protein
MAPCSYQPCVTLPPPSHPPPPLLSFHPFLCQSSYVRLADGWGVQLDVKVLHVCNSMAGDFQIQIHYDGNTDARAAGHGAACAAAAARRHGMHEELAQPQPARGLLIKPRSALKSNVTYHSSQIQRLWEDHSAAASRCTAPITR